MVLLRKWWWFFFCKQKTAYEVRISDWSSDVCSSDLSADFAGDAGAPSVDMAGGPPPIDAAPPPPSNWKNVVGPELMAQIPPIDPYASQGIGAGSGINGEPAMTLPPSPLMRGGMFGNPSAWRKYRSECSRTPVPLAP